MSAKRQATKQLNHENWDDEDPEDHEEMGSFKIAAKDVLEKRVIRTAKRRAPISDEEPKKSVFSGFGFNKSQPASFDFLSKLTNGDNTNGSPNKAETSLTPGLFTSKPTSSPGSDIFGIQTSSTSPFGTTSTTQSGSLFGVSSSIATTTASVFSTSKADSTVGDSPFKTQTVTSTSENTDSTKTTPISTTKFGIPSTSANVSKSLFTASSNTNLFKQTQPTPNATTGSHFGAAAVTKPESNPNETKKGPDDSKKMKYYSKLKGLNESVSDWIKKHVEETPLCILSPIFKDYDNYLKEIQDEYHGSGKEVNKMSEEKSTTSDLCQGGGKPRIENISPAKPTVTMGDKGSSLFNMPPPNSKPSLFAARNNTTDKPASFSFGINTPTSTTSTTNTPGFSFGVTASNQSNVTSTSSSFSFGTNTATNGGASSFSFGAGKPFSFNSNIQQQTTEKIDDANDDEDTPPKVEFTPVVEENSVFDKKCKIFVKKDGNFVDKGVGTLYIKKVGDTGKHQLLVRANTNLGTILINMILSASIPTQRMGKNNVMMVCIPTPDSEPPPTPILIRVKTAEEADGLLETLNKYKV